MQQTCGKEGERIKWSYIKATRQVLQRDNEFLAGCSHPIATSVRFPGLQPQAISTHMAGSFHQRLLAASECCCLQLPAPGRAPGRAPGMAWGSIPVHPGGADQASLGAGPEGRVFSWEMVARRLPVAFFALQRWKGPVKVG